jgi:hypothetical protein
MAKTARIKSRKIFETLYNRPTLYPKEERQIYDWYKQMRTQSIRIDLLTLQNRMREIVPEIYRQVVFKSSFGWLRRFMGRYNLVKRRTCVSGNVPPKDCAVRIS